MKIVKQPVTVAYKLSRIYQYYGSIIFLTVFASTFYLNFSFVKLLPLLAANILMTVFFFSFNNVEDHRDDARDASKVKHNPISDGKVSPAKARILSFLTLAASLYFYSTLGLYTFTLGVITGIVCFLYSWRRVRLKSKPVVDLVSHGLFHVLVFTNTVFAYSSSISIVMAMMMAGLIFFVSALVDFESEIRDYEVDRAANLSNTISKLNIRSSGKMLVYISVLAVLIFFGFLVKNGNLLSGMVMTIFGAFVAFHYLFVWRRESKFVYYYPYTQQTLLAYSFILLVLR